MRDKWTNHCINCPMGLFCCLKKRQRNISIICFPSGGCLKNLQSQNLWLRTIRRKNFKLAVNSTQTTFCIRISDKRGRYQHCIVGMKVGENIQKSPRLVNELLTGKAGTSFCNWNHRDVRDVCCSIRHGFGNNGWRRKP